jgi:hypothetical protein
MNGTRSIGRLLVASSALVGLLLAHALAGPGEKGSDKKRYRGRLGPNSRKVRTEGDKTLLWASGDPDSPEAEWYDFTGSPIPAAELQFGIGKDRIRAIDDPHFVPPVDPRLLKLAVSAYRRDERPNSNDEIKVIGYVEAGEARAYPVALLDHHELVNDRFGAKPVTVGW